MDVKRPPPPHSMLSCFPRGRVAAAAGPGGHHAAGADGDDRPALHSAVLRGNQVVIQVDPARGEIDVNARDEEGNTALHLAIERGYDKWVDYLLDHKADPNAMNKWGMTPLMVAAKHRRPAIMLSLLNCRADVLTTNERQQAALHYAACSGCADCVKYLLTFKPKVNLQDSDGATALLLACKYQHAGIVKQLLKHKAVAKTNPNLKDVAGRAPLHWVAEMGDAETARVLIKANADINCKDGEMETAFVRAIKRDNLAVLQVLVEGGCDRIDVDGLNGSAMTMASMLGRDEVLRLLIKYGEDLDEVGHIGLTPLTAATFEGHVNAVNILLDAGADPNIPSRMGATPIIKVSCFIRECNAERRHKIMAALIRANANPNFRCTKAGYFTAVTNGRNCPLSYALTSGYVSMIQMLLIAGAKVTASEVHEWMRLNEEQNWFNGEQLLGDMYDWATSVRSLRHLARHTIRASLGPCAHLKLSRLPVPPPIQRYLALPELDAVAVKKGEVNEQTFATVALAMHVLPPCGLRALQGTLSYDFYHEMLR